MATNCDYRRSFEGNWVHIETTGTHLESHWLTVCNNENSLAALLGDNLRISLEVTCENNGWHILTIRGHLAATV